MNTIVNYKLLIIILFLPVLWIAQTKIVNNNSFLIEVTNDNYKYVDTPNGTFTTRDYFQFTDPSKAGELKLPVKNIIVAIPPGSSIKLHVTGYESQTLKNVVPSLQPQLKRINDSTIVYEKTDFNTSSMTRSKSAIAETGKYFWFRDYYCVEIRVNTHQYDPALNSIIIYDQIELMLELDGSVNIEQTPPIKVKSKFDTQLQKVIYNFDIAGQFRSSRKYLTADTTGGWINYQQEYVKIGVAHDGIYRITPEDLLNINVPVNVINPKTFAMYESGKTHPIFVSGEDDNFFDGTDYIEFYGSRNYTGKHRIINAADQEYNPYLNKYTDTTYYFLTWGGNSGERITIDNSPVVSGITSLEYYTELRHYEENTMYQNLNNDEIANQTANWYRNKTWYWAWLTTSARKFGFTADEVYPGKNSKVYFKATSAGSNIVNNAHQVTLRFKGEKLDSQNVNRFDQVLLSGSFNSDKLTNGTNQIEVLNYDNGTLPNWFGYDWYEIEYPRYNRLANDSLIITIPYGFDGDIVKINMTGNNSSHYSIYKFYPHHKKIESYQLGTNSLFFTDTVSTGDRYAIVASNRFLKPLLVYKGRFANLRADNSQCDYIAISAHNFIPAVEEYTSLVGSVYGYSYKVVDVEDIFNEFGFGYPTPESIKNFVKYSYDNRISPKPAYLTLFGDASNDYKDYIYKSVGVKLSVNYIPSYGNPVSDNWYAVFDDGGPFIPQLKVGRIPILSSTDLEYYKSKFDNNSNQPFDEWNKRYLLFSGGAGNNASELKSLKAANDSVITKVIEPRPISGNYIHFYKTINPQSDFGPYSPAEIQSAIDKGGVFISYVGHSGTATWDNSINDVTQLQNNVSRNPLMSDFGCSTNKFAEPDIVCFGERFLLNESGQTIGYIGNSSLGFTSTAIQAPTLFYESFIHDSLNEVGNAHLYAKTKLYEIFGNSGVYKSFALSNTLLGDPAVRVNMPTKPNLKIDESSLIYDNSLLTDSQDSVMFRIILTNLGTSEPHNYLLKFSHYYRNQLIKSGIKTLLLPGFQDTVSLWIQTKSLAGEHRLEVNLDSDNNIDEIYEDDNSYEFIFNVNSVLLRDLLPYSIENGKFDSFNIVNPTSRYNEATEFAYEVADNPFFENNNEYVQKLDTLFTRISLNSLHTGKRYWVRYKLNKMNAEYSSSKSFLNSLGSNFYLADSIAFNSQLMQGINYENDLIKLSNDTVNISVLSAGWYAGATCVISKDGINLLDNSFFAGMGITVFDPVTMNVDTSTWFQLYDNIPNAEALAAMINNIPEGKIVVMGVADDGRHRLITELQTAIKTLGSTKIDSLAFRGSWAIIGRKGALPGDPDIIEVVKDPYGGSVLLEKKYVVPNAKGYLVTNRLGPAKSWDSLLVNYEMPHGASIKVIPIGIHEDGSLDTLDAYDITSKNMLLSELLPNEYPYAKLKFELQQNDLGESPLINEIGVSHSNVPELALNYQVVSVERDTIIERENNKLSFYVYNIGESPAENFKVHINLIKPDNSTKLLRSYSVESIDSMSRKYFEYEYVSNKEDGHGNFQFSISVDAEDAILEFYEDNNLYSLPFYVKPDPATSIEEMKFDITFDGNEIFEGDYVTPNPEISIFAQSSDSYSLTDTSCVEIYLDSKRINYTELATETNVPGHEQTYIFKPELQDGKHLLRVLGKGSDQQVIQTTEKIFNVDSEVKLLSIYNYPNPFSDVTNFTFRLTNLPDEISIKIYTVAGRLIRTLDIPRGMLKTDFNSIEWDGRDEDGDRIANGTYLYKIVVRGSENNYSAVKKLAIVR